MSDADLLSGLFKGSDMAHGRTETTGTVTGKGKHDAKSWMEHRAATLADWEAHIAGQKGLGMVPLNSENMVHWGAIDVDIYEGLSIEQLKQLAMTQPEVMERLLPTINKERDAQMSRQMQLNQQLGQLTGALNQQKYMAELAGGAQSEAGATTRTMLTAPNPYAASAFQYRG